MTVVVAAAVECDRSPAVVVAEARDANADATVRKAGANAATRALLTPFSPARSSAERWEELPACSPPRIPVAFCLALRGRVMASPFQQKHQRSPNE